jgi:copper chaperone CopZ
MKKMKNIIIITMAALAMSFGKPPKYETVSFTVEGTCSMCKDRIEEALDKRGIRKAVYSPDDKTLTVTYNPKKLDEIQLHNLVAIAGHDTELVKASNAAYMALPDCCRYREGAKCDD